MKKISIRKVLKKSLYVVSVSVLSTAVALGSVLGAMEVLRCL